jgi:predicted Ser/Thr protein kinase
MLDKSDNLWIIDFEHSKCREKDEEINEFLKEFINGKNEWNPEFK